MRFSHYTTAVFFGLLLLCAAPGARADQVVVDFDNLPTGLIGSQPHLSFSSVWTVADGHTQSVGSGASVESSGQAGTPPNALFAWQTHPLGLRYNNVSGQFRIGLGTINNWPATTDFVSMQVVGTLPGQTEQWTLAFYDLTFNPYDLTTGLIGSFSGTTDQLVTFSSGTGTHAFVLINSGPNRHEGVDTITFNAPQVPEPATLLLLGTGLAGVAGSVRRRRRGRRQG